MTTLLTGEAANTNQGQAAASGAAPEGAPAPAPAAPTPAPTTPTADGGKQPQEAPKPEGTKPAAPEAKKEEPKPFTLTGEGVDAGVLSTAAKALFDAGVPAEKAQPLFDALAGAVRERGAELHAEQLAQRMSADAELVRKDPDIGGTKLADTVKLGKAVLGAFDAKGEALRVFEQAGVANHPAVMRFLRGIGEAIETDRFVGGNAPNGQPTGPRDMNQLASGLYPQK